MGKCGTNDKGELTYGEGLPFERIRRITGYLVGSLDRFNSAKKSEVDDRVQHGLGEKTIAVKEPKESLPPEIENSFALALIWLKQGGEVRRECCPQSIVLEDDKIKLVEFNQSREEFMLAEIVDMPSSHLLANDWQWYDSTKGVWKFFNKPNEKDK